ncbi:hypothetical protein C6495_02410 [Candidatus Poribacteria bacterium]|nr:MAG: hypothetical protein C6495_02410 [Candidatus Poribacteria bacterium]
MESAPTGNDTFAEAHLWTARLQVKKIGGMPHEAGRRGLKPRNFRTARLESAPTGMPHEAGRRGLKPRNFRTARLESAPT